MAKRVSRASHSLNSLAPALRLTSHRTCVCVCVSNVQPGVAVAALAFMRDNDLSPLLSAAAATPCQKCREYNRAGMPRMTTGDCKVLPTPPLSRFHFDLLQTSHDIRPLEDEPQPSPLPPQKAASSQPNPPPPGSTSSVSWPGVVFSVCVNVRHLRGLCVCALRCALKCAQLSSLLPTGRHTVECVPASQTI